MNSSPEPESTRHEDDDVMNLTDLAQLCGIEPNDIIEYHRLHIVSLRSSGGGYHAGTRTLHRLRNISILRDEHEMKPTSIGFVLDLMDRLESAERELRMLRERL